MAYLRRFWVKEPRHSEAVIARKRYTLLWRIYDDFGLGSPVIQIFFFRRNVLQHFYRRTDFLLFFSRKKFCISIYRNTRLPSVGSVAAQVDLFAAVLSSKAKNKTTEQSCRPTIYDSICRTGRRALFLLCVPDQQQQQLMMMSTLTFSGWPILIPLLIPLLINYVRAGYSWLGSVGRPHQAQAKVFAQKQRSGFWHADNNSRRGLIAYLHISPDRASEGKTCMMYRLYIHISVHRYTYMDPLLYERVPVDAAAFSSLPRVLFVRAMWSKDRVFLRFISGI